jgi:hypothetical protein
MAGAQTKEAGDISNFLEQNRDGIPLWELQIEELAGHNIESRGREEVNELMKSGWLLLHIYTLRFHEDNVWRERPMAILGRPKSIPRTPAHAGNQNKTS